MNKDINGAAAPAPPPGRAAVIMAGGAGERFWPASRRDRPKPFLRAGQESLIESTVRRALDLVEADRVLIITTAELVDAFREALPAVPGENILGEPVGRNTAACVALSAVEAERRWGEDTVLVTEAADHFIRDEARFREVLASGMALAAREDVLITVGIVPDRADTGFGYIRAGGERPVPGTARARQAAAFVEKPDEATARRFLDDGTYLWNSGMFIWSVRAIREALERHLPELTAPMAAYRAAWGGPEAAATLSRIYPDLPRLPIDKGVMEKAGNVVVLDGDFGWDDIGTWPALSRVLGTDADGNTALAPHVGLETTGTLVYADEGLVATYGVKDLIVARHGDAVLVCSRDKASELKQLVAELAKRAEARPSL